MFALSSCLPAIADRRRGEQSEGSPALVANARAGLPDQGRQTLFSFSFLNCEQGTLNREQIHIQEQIFFDFLLDTCLKNSIVYSKRIKGICRGELDRMDSMLATTRSRIASFDDPAVALISCILSSISCQNSSAKDILWTAK